MVGGRLVERGEVRHGQGSSETGENLEKLPMESPGRGSQADSDFYGVMIFA